MADDDNPLRDDPDAGIGIHAAAELLRMGARSLSDACREGWGPRPYHARPLLFTRRELVAWQAKRQEQLRLETEAKAAARREKKKAKREREKERERERKAAEAAGKGEAG